MSKFKLPNKFKSNTTQLTSETTLVQGPSVNGERRFDIMYRGQSVQSISVDKDDEVRKEFTAMPGGVLNNLINDPSEDNQLMLAHMSQLILWAIHPCQKLQAEQFLSNNQ